MSWMLQPFRWEQKHHVCRGLWWQPCVGIPPGKIAWSPAPQPRSTSVQILRNHLLFYFITKMFCIWFPARRGQEDREKRQQDVQSAMMRGQTKRLREGCVTGTRVVLTHMSEIVFLQSAVTGAIARERTVQIATTYVPVRGTILVEGSTGRCAAAFVAFQLKTSWWVNWKLKWKLVWAKNNQKK